MPERKEERSIGELFAQLASETTTLVRQEVQLAKLELSQKASQVGKQNPSDMVRQTDVQVQGQCVVQILVQRPV